MVINYSLDWEFTELAIEQHHNNSLLYLPKLDEVVFFVDISESDFDFDGVDFSNTMVVASLTDRTIFEVPWGTPAVALATDNVLQLVRRT